MLARLFIIMLFLSFGCGSQEHGEYLPPVSDLCGGNMLTLNANFKAALLQPNTPSFIAKFVQSEIYAETNSQTDWLAYKQAVNVDLTTEPGTLMIPATVPSQIITTANNATLCFGSASTSLFNQDVSSPATPGTDSYAWQSFKQSSGQNRYIDKVKLYLYAIGNVPETGTFYNTFYVQLYATKAGATISTLKSIGGAEYQVDGFVTFDFSAEEIVMTSGTTYWMKIYAVSRAVSYSGFGATASSYLRYHTTTTTYVDGQLDGKPYDGVNVNNRGDAAFAITFLSQASGTGHATYQLDLGSVPTVDGEWRLDKLTPQDSSLSIRAQAYDSIDSVEKSDLGGSVVSYVSLADNGSRMVRVSGSSPYIQYSDDRGATWATAASGAFGASTVVWTGTRFVAIGYNASTSKYSTDGSNWTAGGALPASGYWEAVWTGVSLVAAMWGGDGATSTDGGASWVARTMAGGATKQWQALHWNGTNILAIEYGTNYAASSDSQGVTWTARTLATTNNWVSVTYGNGLWVVQATGTGYNTSPNLTAWTSRTHGTALTYKDINYNGNVFVAIGDIGYAYSVSGTSWTYNATGASGKTIIPVDGRFYACNPYGYHYSHPGHTELGIVTDAQAITTRKRYYAFTAFLSPDTTASWTPSLRSVQAYFPTWLVLSTTAEKGYEVAISSVSSLQSSIDTFKPSTVGQITLGLALTKQVSNYLKTAYPRNKEVRILAGFTTLSEGDYINYYRGNIEEWKFGQKRDVSISLRDFSKTWKGVPVPAKWESASDDITWTAQHHIDVMIDVMQGYIGVPSKAIMGSSFSTVKTELSGWKVTNTLTGKTFDAKDIMEDLRFITGTFFIPQPDGRIKLKRWDKDEAVSASLSDAEMIDVSYMGNSASLVNLINWYYNMTTEGVGKAGGIALYQAQDGASQYNWGEKKVFEFKDYWTLTAEEITQVQPTADSYLLRYAAVPDVLAFQLDLRFIDLELADMVSITTKMAPSTDLSGISGVKYQIVRKDIDFQKSRIKLEVLRAS